MMNYRFLMFFFFFFIIVFCKKQEEKAELSIFGLNLTSNFYYFEGKINKDITPYCGEVVQSTSSTGNTGTTQSSAQTTQTQFDINSYYNFEFGDYMQLRYTYDKNRQKFTLTPSTTSTMTCNTIDFINCNSSGTATCETSDNIKCGGAKAFIFVGVVNPIHFQAISGTLDWSKGYSLTSDNKYVQKATLEFRMIDKSGNILQGKVFCVSDFN